GDIILIEMKGAPMLVQSGSYLASENGVDIEAKISSKAFVAAEGFSMLEATGTGKMLVTSYGAIFEKVLGPNEKYIVDTSHLVAFDASMNVERKGVGGAKSNLFSGEGFVVVMTGPGHVYIQTRSPKALIAWIIPQVPQKSN
ncbi:MAG: AIM24 family protein, partial [Chloroflexota bacterium]